MRIPLKPSLTSALVAAALAAPLAAGAASYTVPDHFSTIQRAIDAAASGDTIYVRPGIYYENVSIPGEKGLTLKSLAGAARSIIDGRRLGPAVYIGGNGSATVEGFTIQNGSGAGLQSNSSNSPLTINLNDSVVTNNAGSGIDTSGGGYVAWITLNVNRCAITSNNASYGGGLRAIYTQGYVYDSIVANNTAVDGGGYYGAFLGYMSFYRSFITGNHASGRGGGSYSFWYATYAWYEDCVIDGNSAEGRGGAFYAEADYYRGAIYLVGSTVSNNTSVGEGGGGYFETRSVGSIFWSQSSIVWGNSSPPFFEPAVDLSVANSDIQGWVEDAPGQPNHGIQGVTNNISVDPLFVDGAVRDYRLFTGSPAIDAGVVSGFDILGTPRPQGHAGDMGAYEWTESIAPTSEAVVTGTLGQGGIYTSAAAVTVTAQDLSGVASIHYTVNGAETVVNAPSATFTLTADGTYAVTWWSVDAYGNAEPVKSLPAITVDQTAPTATAAVAGTAGTNGWYRSAVTVSLAAQDAVGVRELHYTVNGVETLAAGASASVTLSAGGSYAVTYWAVDLAGNASAVQSLPTIKLDLTAPAVVRTSPAKDATGVSTSTTVTVTFGEAVAQGPSFSGVALKRGSTKVTATTTLSGTVITLVPSSRLSSSTTYTVTVPAGAVVDEAGNQNAAYTFSFRTR